MNAAGASPWTSGYGQNSPFGIMAILNITPDSFFDGGENLDNPLEVFGRLVADGADIIDIGAESTAPGAAPVEPKLEKSRLEPLLRKIRRKFPDVPVSVDTRHAETAAMALELGAKIINDVSAFSLDAALPEVLAAWRPGYVLTHGKGAPVNMSAPPRYDNLVDEVENFFEAKLNQLVAAGLPEDRIVLDPGIGFDKTPEQNLLLLANMERFLKFGRPLLAGISMKSFFGALFGLPLRDRGEATAIVSALLWEKGVFWHRVHEPGRARKALRLASALAENNADTGAPRPWPRIGNATLQRV